MPVNNPILDAIATRTSIRKYQDRPVAKETINAMLRAAMAAPSARNSQPWRFVVVSDRSVLNQLADALTYGGMLRHAPLAVVVAGAPTDEPGERYWVQDCSAATQNLLLSAHALGLGAVWLGVHSVPDREVNVARVVGLPEGTKPLCVVSIGYPDGDHSPQDKYDPEKVHWEKW